MDALSRVSSLTDRPDRTDPLPNFDISSPLYTPKNGMKRERFSKSYRLLEAPRPDQERR